MEGLAELVLFVLSIAIAVYILVGYLRGSSELVSIRNVALGGFILFQSLSAAIWLRRDGHVSTYNLLTPGETGLKFFGASVVFLVIALVVYQRGWLARPLARLVPKPNVVPTPTAMWFTGIVLTLSAAVLRFALLIPYVNILGEIMGTAVAGCAAGIAGWFIGRNLLNPVVLACAGALIVANLGIALTGEYGRRSLITIGFGVMFGMYYSRLRYLRPSHTVTLLLIAAIPVLLFTAAYTSIRGQNRRADFGTFVRAIVSAGDVSKGLTDVDGQGTGGVSLWLMEFFGPNGVQEPQQFRAFRYFVVYPVPRAMFPYKPEPLSLDIPRLANLEGVTQGSLTIGPGIIGHSFADGGWHVLIFYAAFGGFIIRFGDEMIRRSPHAPFVVLPCGSMLGEFMGLARGETSAMLFLAVFGTVTCYVYVASIGKVLQWIGYAHEGDPNVADMGDSLFDEDWDDEDDPYPLEDEYTRLDDD